MLSLEANVRMDGDLRHSLLYLPSVPVVSQKMTCILACKEQFSVQGERIEI